MGQRFDINSFILLTKLNSSPKGHLCVLYSPICHWCKGSANEILFVYHLLCQFSRWTCLPKLITQIRGDAGLHFACRHCSRSRSTHAHWVAPGTLQKSEVKDFEIFVNFLFHFLDYFLPLFWISKEGSKWIFKYTDNSMDTYWILQ